MTRVEDDTRANDGAADHALHVLHARERDDVDAAIDFLAQRSDASSPGPDADTGGETTFDFSRYRARRIREQLIVLLDQLHGAIERRDVDRVEAVLDAAEAYRCLPAGVREEAIVMAQLPAASLRAPMRLYRYQYLLSRLGDEPIESALDPTQLAMDFAPAAPSDSPSSVRELPFLERPFPERRSPRGGPRRGGDDRRRSGSR
jgi:hypothetical protein